MIGFVILPALVGALVLAFGLQGSLAAAQPGNSDRFASGLRAAAIPISVGVVLLLTALAVAKRSRPAYCWAG